MNKTSGIYRLYRLMLSGYCTAHRIRARDNTYTFTIKRYLPWKEERIAENVIQYYYVVLNPDGVIIVTEDLHG